MGLYEVEALWAHGPRAVGRWPDPVTQVSALSPGRGDAMSALIDRVGALVRLKSLREMT